MINWSKYILGLALVLIVSALAVTSCTKGVYDEPIMDGETVEVSFNTAFDNSEATRAWDGTNVDKLYVELYLNGAKVGERLEYSVSNGRVERFSISLLKNQTYIAVFWAQNSQCDAYTIGDDLSDISVDYTQSVGLETTADRDAFFDSIEFTVNNDTQQYGVDVSLTRPFAMVVAGTAVSNLQDGATTALKLSHVATKFDAKKGVATGNAPLKIGDFIPSSAVTVPGKNEAMLAIAYVLPVANQAVEVTIDAQVGQMTKQTKLTIAKLEADKQYNIIGNILPANQ